MKKVGSSKSRSKTRRTSKNTAPRTPKASDQLLAVGHEPVRTLAPQDEELFRAFQANLLSLVSHELRTPLTGILNALAALDEGIFLKGLSQSDLIKMARENAFRLHQALMTLLDLATLESRTFHLRLREVDLLRLTESRMEAHQTQFKDRSLKFSLEKDMPSRAVLLADPQRLGRVLDLCLQVLIPRVEEGSSIKVRISSSGVTFIFELARAMEKLWETSWSQSLIGFHSGIGSPYSAFGGVLGSEQEFLTRVQEGFGSEFLLIHEIMKLHNGIFKAQLNDRIVELSVELPELSSEEALTAVLKSRAFQVSTELGAVALILMEIPRTVPLEQVREAVQKALTRTTDAVYPLTKRHQLAVVMDDCKPEEVPVLMNRLRTHLTSLLNKNLHFGIAHCPADTLDPASLVRLGEERLARAVGEEKS